MNFIKQIGITILICLVLQYFFPWWTLVLGAFAGGYLFGESSGKSFLAGFVAVALLWLITAMIIDVQTNSILTEKVARIFPTKTPALLFVLTAVIGGLPAGFAAMTGRLIRSK